jgi:hypothetical protein
MENNTTQDQEFARAAEQMMRDDGATAEALQPLGAAFLAEFSQAVQDRQEVETRWLRDLRQFKGIYDPEVEALIGTKRSRHFVRRTRAKVRTANARMLDLLFPASKRKNWKITPTPVPTVSQERKNCGKANWLSSLHELKSPQASFPDVRTHEPVEKMAFQ